MIRALYFTALSLWVGGLTTLAFVVAPTVFSHAESPAVAGRIFGPTLRVFGYVELACAAVVLASGIALHLRGEGPGWAKAVRLALLAVMILILVAHVFGISPQIAAERERVAHFETLKKGDPERERFDRLHQGSVRLVVANVLLGLALVSLSGATLRA